MTVVEEDNTEVQVQKRVGRKKGIKETSNQPTEIVMALF